MIGLGKHSTFFMLIKSQVHLSSFCPYKCLYLHTLLILFKVWFFIDDTLLIVIEVWLDLKCILLLPCYMWIKSQVHLFYFCLYNCLYLDTLLILFEAWYCIDSHRGMIGLGMHSTFAMMFKSQVHLFYLFLYKCL